MKIRFVSRAVNDLEATLRHYGELGTDLRPRFRVDFDAALERLVMFPNGAPPVEGFPGLRRARMRRFPYGIFYRPDAEELLILRVLHAIRPGPISAEPVTRVPPPGVLSTTRRPPSAPSRSSALRRPVPGAT